MTVDTVIVVDTETSDLPDAGGALMEIAVVPVKLPKGGDSGNMIAWSVDPSSAFSCYIEHVGPVSPVARAVHHIDPASCAPGAPGCLPRDRAIGRVRQAEDPDAMLYAAHNVEYDRHFLGDLGLPWICTYQCARHIWPDAPSYKNQALRYWLGLEPPAELLTGLEAHRALYDAAVTAALLCHMLQERSAEELVRLTNSPVLLTTCNFGKYRDQLWSEVPVDYLRWMRRNGVKADDKNIQHTIDHYIAA